METQPFYMGLYQMFDTATPLHFDCGRLCAAACCRVCPELPGMYLFPGEEALFQGLKGFTASQAALPGYGPVGLISCTGVCSRASRPLSCRVFPLAPKVEEGRVSVRPDPRGLPICPLCRQEKQALSPDFVRAVEAAFAVLLTEPATRDFIVALSRYLDEFALG